MYLNTYNMEFKFKIFGRFNPFGIRSLLWSFLMYKFKSNTDLKLTPVILELFRYGEKV